MNSQGEQKDLAFVHQMVGQTSTISDADFELYRNWIYQSAGISLTPTKKALVVGRLSSRLRELGVTTYRDYFEYLTTFTNQQERKLEQQRVINLLTTNETYFFREEAHFTYIQHSLFAAWAGQPIRCWSAASSTGEEAYSLAMLLDSHYPGRWQIVGTDINSQVLHIASQGIYPMLRHEHIPQVYLKKYCRKGIGSKQDTLKIVHSLRSHVKFERANLQRSLDDLGLFDLVFLRNVMIYFDKSTKQRVITNVASRLKNGGILLIGHSETLNGLDCNELQLLQPSIYQKRSNAD
ncbi:CheR family methyltransferase [Vibrio salilacus]|uniref:CheR family methyltransferase n=1 Tax=Vibrio salilacus TaxID=1323749 RepID=UPI000C2AF7ED|nr:protein-glutamate O-methyltransferase CheR [Vibrio salilacus]